MYWVLEEMHSESLAVMCMSVSPSTCMQIYACFTLQMKGFIMYNLLYHF